MDQLIDTNEIIARLMAVVCGEWSTTPERVWAGLEDGEWLSGHWDGWGDSGKPMDELVAAREFLAGRLASPTDFTDTPKGTP